MLLTDKISKQALVVSLLLTVLFISGATLECYAETLRSTTISNLRDKKGRNPDLGVTVFKEGETVKIAADAHIPDKEIARFPIVFDFFINRRLFSTQYRSQGLPGAVGVDIGSDVATPPFNYTVIATVQTPNGRNFKTIIDGAVFSSDLATTFNECVLTLASTGSAAQENVKESSVTAKQFSNESFDISFKGNGSDTGDEISVATTVSVAEDNSLSGTLTTVRNNDKTTARTTDLSGTAVLDTETGGLISFSASSTDGNTVLVCS